MLSAITRIPSFILSNAAAGDEAGLCVFLDAGKHYDIFLRENGGPRSIVLRYRLDFLTHIEKEIPVNTDSSVKLSIRCRGDSYSFFYSIGEDETITPIGTMGTRYLSEEVHGGFTGCLFGLYCVSANKTDVAEFKYFSSTEIIQ